MSERESIGDDHTALAAVPTTGDSTRTSSSPDDSGRSSSEARRPSRLREVSPRHLCEFTNPSHLTTVMLDAIAAHKRLYQEGGVLHGDVNVNTILIIDSPADDKSEGALVDFDMPIIMPASVKDGEASTATERCRPYYWRAPGL